MCEPRPIFSPQYWRKKIPPNTLHKSTRKRLPGYSLLNLGGPGKERRVLDSAHVSLDVGHFGACWAHAWPIVVPIEAFVGLGQLGRGGRGAFNTWQEQRHCASVRRKGAKCVMNCDGGY